MLTFLTFVLLKIAPGRGSVSKGTDDKRDTYCHSAQSGCHAKNFPHSPGEPLKVLEQGSSMIIGKL